MNIIIRETNELKDLSVIDRNTGVEWTADMITSGNFEHDENGTTIMNQADYEWWEEYINDYEADEEAAADLADDLGVSVADIWLLADIDLHDYDQHHAARQTALEAAREKYGK